MTFKVLIVEDDPVTAKVNLVSLEKMGFSVGVVNQGDQALAAMKSHQPDVVVLDLELPGQNGVQILQNMQLDPELRNVIVIAHTAHIDADDDLGFAYFAQYQRNKQEEPLMIGKVQKKEDSWRNVRFAIAKMVGEKFGSLPKPLADWVETNPFRD